jgi:hypothetical protein
MSERFDKIKEKLNNKEVDSKTDHYEDMLRTLQERKARKMRNYLQGRPELDKPRIDALDIIPGNRIKEVEDSDAIRIEKGQDINELPDMKEVSDDIRHYRKLLEEAKKKK